MKRVGVILVLVVAAACAAAAHGLSGGKVVIKNASGGDLAIGTGAVWVGSHRGYAVYRINPRTNTKRAIVIPQNSCNFTTFAGGYVFQSGCNDTLTTLQIDPRTNKVIRHLPGAFGVGGAGSLWVVDQNRKIERDDPHSGVRLATINAGVDLSENGGPIGVFDGGLWVAADTALSRIDVQTNKVTSIIPLPGAKGSGSVNGGYLYGGFGAFLNGKLWVSNPAGLYKVDPRRGTATLLSVRVMPMSTGGDVQVAAGAGSLWMRTGDHWVARVDPTSGTVVQRYPASGGGGGVAVGFGSLWVGNVGADSIWRYPIR